jgi:hypothetical protein
MQSLLYDWHSHALSLRPHREQPPPLQLQTALWMNPAPTVPGRIFDLPQLRPAFCIKQKAATMWQPELVT